MSLSPHVLTSARWGTKMGNVVAIDAMLTVLSDPFEGCHMGITAENVARKHSISREAQDALAIESHKRAARAQAEGRFTSQILPIEVNRSEEHTSELQSLMRISYAVFCLNKKNQITMTITKTSTT